MKKKSSVTRKEIENRFSRKDEIVHIDVGSVDQQKNDVQTKMIEEVTNQQLAALDALKSRLKLFSDLRDIPTTIFMNCFAFEKKVENGKRTSYLHLKLPPKSNKNKIDWIKALTEKNKLSVRYSEGKDFYLELIDFIVPRQIDLKGIDAYNYVISLLYQLEKITAEQKDILDDIISSKISEAKKAGSVRTISFVVGQQTSQEQTASQVQTVDTMRSVDELPTKPDGIISNVANQLYQQVYQQAIDQKQGNPQQNRSVVSESLTNQNLPTEPPITVESNGNREQREQQERRRKRIVEEKRRREQKEQQEALKAETIKQVLYFVLTMAAVSGEWFLAVELSEYINRIFEKTYELETMMLIWGTEIFLIPSLAIGYKMWTKKIENDYAIYTKMLEEYLKATILSAVALDLLLFLPTGSFDLMARIYSELSQAFGTATSGTTTPGFETKNLQNINWKSTGVIFAILVSLIYGGKNIRSRRIAESKDK